MTKTIPLLIFGLVFLTGAYVFRKHSVFRWQLVFFRLFGALLVPRASLALLGVWPLSAFEQARTGEFAAFAMCAYAAAICADLVRVRRRAQSVGSPTEVGRN